MQVWGIFSSLHCTPGKYSSPSTPHTSAVLPVVEQREQSPPSSPVSEMTQIRSSKCHTVSLVPRPPPNLVSRLHPLMRRNSLVNQVEFLGPAHAFCYSPAHFVENSLKSLDTQMEMILLWRKFYMIITDLAILLGFYCFWIISPRNLTSFSGLFLPRRRMQAGHETNPHPTSHHLQHSGFHNCKQRKSGV